MKDLDDLQSVTEKLQSDIIDLADARALFDAVLEKFPVMTQYLAPAADIVNNPNFENAIVKVLNDDIWSMNRTEEKVVECFLKSKIQVEEKVTLKEEKDTFADEVLERKRRRMTYSCAPSYESLKFIPPTTNCIERVFSKAKYIMTPHREKMTPMNFEMLVFLKVNRSLWDLSLLDV